MRIPEIRPRRLVWIDEKIPLLGHIAFGVVDRGTNIIQVRPTTLCHLNCIYCSVDAGPYSKHRLTEYMVKLDWLVEWVKYIVRYKSVNDIEALIDGVGEPLTYPYIVELVQELKDIKGIRVVALQTRGYLLTRRLVDELDEVGLDRINLSIDTLDVEKAKYIQGSEWFNVLEVKEITEYILSNTSIDVHIAPVWVPGINDKDIEDIIEWVKKIKAGRKWPALGIQKYLVHRYGRKPRGVKPVSWRDFWGKLRELERKHGIKLIHDPKAFNFHRAPSPPPPYRRGEKIKVRIVEEGWLRGEKLGVPKNNDRVITVVDASRIPLNTTVKIRIIENNNNIFIARPLP